MALTLEDELVYVTVPLEFELSDGRTAVGTGFFYLFCRGEEGAIPALVTNKHVVAGAVRGRFHVHLATGEGHPSGTHIPIEMESIDGWFDHPNAEVDLCALPVTSLLEQAEAERGPIFFRPLTDKLFQVPGGTGADALSPIEEVVMVGYPNGIRDEANNRPIVRRGITATDPRLNYNGRPEFLIDAACYPGSSGSPVFLYNRFGVYSPPGGGLLGGKKLTFLGILYAGPVYTAEGKIVVVDIPTAFEPVPRTEVPMNLGNVIHALQLSDFEPMLKERYGAPAV